MKIDFSPAAAADRDSAWQDLLCRIDGVYSAYISWTPEDTPAEIHILASNQKSPKAVTRDIQSALAAAFGVTVDYRIVSVAQIPPPMAPAHPLRLRYDGMTASTHGTRLDVTVSLSCGEEVRTGSSSCSTSAVSRVRGVAQATLNAIGGFTGSPEQFELMATDFTAAMGQKVLLAVVHSPSEGRHFLGSAFAAPDPDSAAVHAVLDALNRRLERMISCI